MSYPTNCFNCDFCNRCISAMYTDGCKFFPPEMKKENKLKKFFGKFFK